MGGKFWPPFWVTVRTATAIWLTLWLRPHISGLHLPTPLAFMVTYFIPALIVELVSDKFFSTPKLTASWFTISKESPTPSRLRQDRFNWPKGKKIWQGELHVEISPGGYLYKYALLRGTKPNVEFGLFDDSGFELSVENSNSTNYTNVGASGKFEVAETSKGEFSAYARFKLRKLGETDTASRKVNLEVTWGDKTISRFCTSKDSSLKMIDL